MRRNRETFRQSLNGILERAEWQHADSDRKAYIGDDPECGTRKDFGCGARAMDTRQFAFGGLGGSAVSRRANYDGSISCAIPGHDHPGTEYVASLSINRRAVAVELRGALRFRHRLRLSRLTIKLRLLLLQEASHGKISGLQDGSCGTIIQAYW